MPKVRVVKRRRNMNKRLRVSKAVKHYVHKTLDGNLEKKDSFNTGMSGGYVINTGGITQLSNTGQIYKLTSLIPQGVENFQRIGDEIKLKEIGIRMIFRMLTDNGTQFSNNVRCIVFSYKKSTTGGSASSTSVGISDILDNDANSTDWVTAPYKFENRHNFKILYDKVFNMTFTEGQYAAVQYYKYHPVTIHLRRGLPAHTRWLDSGVSNPSTLAYPATANDL